MTQSHLKFVRSCNHTDEERKLTQSINAEFQQIYTSSDIFSWNFFDVISYGFFLLLKYDIA